jgi:hypothetical protein
MIVCVTILVGCGPQMAGVYRDSNRLSRGRKPTESQMIPSGSPQAERAVRCGSCKEASSGAAVARADRGFCPVIRLPSATAVGTNRRPLTKGAPSEASRSSSTFTRPRHEPAPDAVAADVA